MSDSVTATENPIPDRGGSLVHGPNGAGRGRTLYYDVLQEAPQLAQDLRGVRVAEALHALHVDRQALGGVLAARGPAVQRAKTMYVEEGSVRRGASPSASWSRSAGRVTVAGTP